MYIMTFTPYQIPVSLGPPKEIQVGGACDMREKGDECIREFVAKVERNILFPKIRPK
jgi:hypothetical protein